MLRMSIIWIVALAIAVASFGFALSSFTKSRAPDIALSVYPQSGFALEKKVNNLVIALVTKDKGQFPDRIKKSWQAVAIRSFVAEPIVPDAIAAMALAAKDDDRRNLMQKALDLSRRQQLVTSWMIVDSGARHDLADVLSYYDTTIRTNPNAADVVIPIMVVALKNNDSIDPFANLMRRKPPWSALFWRSVASTPDAVGNGALLRQRLYNAKEDNSVYQDHVLINSLVQNGDFEKAEELYETLTSKPTKPTLIRQPNFETQSRYPPLHWQLVSNGEFGSTIDESSLNLSAISNSGGMFARQLIKIPKQTLQMKVDFLTLPPENANVNVRLSCAESLSNAPVPLKINLERKTTIQKFNNRLSQCEFFWLEVWAQSSETGDGFDASINSILLEIV